MQPIATGESWDVSTSSRFALNAWGGAGTRLVARTQVSPNNQVVELTSVGGRWRYRGGQKKRMISVRWSDMGVLAIFFRGAIAYLCTFLVSSLLVLPSISYEQGLP